MKKLWGTQIAYLLEIHTDILWVQKKMKEKNGKKFTIDAVLCQVHERSI